MSERPILAMIDTVKTGSLDSAKVVLAYREETHSGTASASVGPDDSATRLRNVAEAAARAVEAGVNGRWALEVRDAGLEQVGGETVCVALIADLEMGDLIFGIAGVGTDDVEKAMARAVLDATNRRMLPKLDAD